MQLAAAKCMGDEVQLQEAGQSSEASSEEKLQAGDEHLDAG